MKKKLAVLVALMAASFILFTGCKGGSTKPVVEEPKEITVLGTVTGDELPLLEACFDPFEAETGVTIKYEPTREFENLINVRVEAGNPPDLALFPQPGLAMKYAREGKAVKLDAKTAANVKKNYSQGWVDLMTVDGTLFGVVHSVNIKSIVIYPKKAWKEKGWEVPKTWEDLEALCQQMVDAGEAPWAVGLESGGATGWPATDWIEDIMLRTAGPDKYDQWVNHELAFDSPEVKKAFEVLGDMWLSKGYVYGGAANIPTTAWGDAPKVLFDNPPKAWMHRQGNFVVSFLPDYAKDNVDEEVGVFALPPIDPQWGTPVLGAGLIFFAFKDKPEVHDFLYYLTTAKSTEGWAKTGGALFAHKDQDLSIYPTEFTQELVKVLMNAKVFKFDASDLMPAQVGAGSFWNGMVEFVNGKDVDKVLSDIDASWP